MRRPEARHFEQAIRTIMEMYPSEIYGLAERPLPSKTPDEVVNLVEAKAARMARKTCSNILLYAQELADAEAAGR